MGTTVIPAPLRVAQVCGVRCDPAFDRAHEDWPRRVERYLRTRAEADLDALPLLAGRRPTYWLVGHLAPAAWMALDGVTVPAARAVVAVQFGCLARIDPGGHEVAAPRNRVRPGQAPSATEAWTTAMALQGGGELIEEIAAVVRRRYEVGDYDGADDGENVDAEGFDAGPLGWYAPPPGLSAARARRRPSPTSEETAGATSSTT